jgi:LysM repeat protein
MRKAALAGFFACAIVFAAGNSQVGAEPLDLINSTSTEQNILAYIEPPKTETEAVKPEPKIHEVKVSETLTKIAEQYATTWVRLFNKNEQLADPDVLQVGDKLTIPEPDEVLADRPLPQPPQPVVVGGQAAPSSWVASRGSSTGNTYTPGYCTWYAKNKRPDLPNNLGNADTWVARAAAQGIPTGSAPRVGAIGQQGMHVVYVERVNGDGTVTISEMNFEGLYVISTRTVYIY